MRCFLLRLVKAGKDEQKGSSLPERVAQGQGEVKVGTEMAAEKKTTKSRAEETREGARPTRVRAAGVGECRWATEGPMSEAPPPGSGASASQRHLGRLMGAFSTAQQATAKLSPHLIRCLQGMGAEWLSQVCNLRCHTGPEVRRAPSLV